MMQHRSSAFSHSPWIKRLAAEREYGVAAILSIAVAAVTMVNPAFLHKDNLNDLLVYAAPAAIVGCGVMLVIVTGEIDISVGSLMGLLAAVLGILGSSERLGLPAWMAVPLVMLLGTAVGLLNGVLVAVGRVPSIIVTLGMLSALRGATELLMAGRWITDLPEDVRFLGTGHVLGIRVAIAAAAVVALAVWGLARATPLGLRIYAAGSNPAAARLAGLPIARLKIFSFALTGFLVAVATVVSVPQLSVIESGIGTGFELLVVTCVLVGGTSISGGRGTVAGTLLGVALLSMVRTALIFLKLGEGAAYWERAIQGGFILLAVLLDHVARRGRGESG